MNRSRRSSESQPEFFADRCLAKRAPAILVQRGWIVHTLAQHFPDDARNVSDPEWVEYGLERGWSLLTQDERMSTQTVVIGMLRRYKGSVHCLDNGNLSGTAKADRFDSHRGEIWQHARDRKVGFYLVPEFGPLRRKRNLPRV